jgi:hypothetical protein
MIMLKLKRKVTVTIAQIQWPEQPESHCWFVSQGKLVLLRMVVRSMKAK